jgi:hypothetical protein
MLRHFAKAGVKADVITGVVGRAENRCTLPVFGFGRLFAIKHNLLTILFNPRLANTNANTGNTLNRVTESKRHLLFPLSKLIKKNIFPDSHVFSVPVLTRKGKELLQKNHYDAIITSAFPLSTFFVGWYLKARYPRVKWVMDLGDPWSHSPSLPWSRGIRNRFSVATEKVILRKLDGLVVTTPETRDLYKREFRSKSRPFQLTVIPPGVDVKSYYKVQRELGENVKGIRNCEPIRFVYTGQFLDNIREPFTFYSALNILDRKLLAKIRIDIYGNMPRQFRCHLPKLCDMNIVNYYGIVPNHQIAKFQSEADILLLFSNASSYQLPSKVFEYAAAKKPILCIKQQESDIAGNFVQKHKLGWVIQNNEVGISDFISKIVTQKMHNRTLNSTLDINSISWESRTMEFFSFLKKICQKSLP